jgi:hypothetical protein
VDGPSSHPWIDDARDGTDPARLGLNGKVTRVDLDRMQKAYDATRVSAQSVPVLTQRAVAHIDKDMHMVGRVGRFQIESYEPPERG